MNHLLLLVIILYYSMLYELNILSYHHCHIDVYIPRAHKAYDCVCMRMNRIAIIMYETQDPNQTNERSRYYFFTINKQNAK